MIHSSSNHKRYTLIQDFKINLQKELKEKINNYCKNLIEFINTKIIECFYCKSSGIVINKDKKETK